MLISHHHKLCFGESEKDERERERERVVKFLNGFLGDF